MISLMLCSFAVLINSLEPIQIELTEGEARIYLNSFALEVCLYLNHGCEFDDVFNEDAVNRVNMTINKNLTSQMDFDSFKTKSNILRSKIEECLEISLELDPESNTFPQSPTKSNENRKIYVNYNGAYVYFEINSIWNPNNKTVKSNDKLILEFEENGKLINIFSESGHVISVLNVFDVFDAAMAGIQLFDSSDDPYSPNMKFLGLIEINKLDFIFITLFSIWTMIILIILYCLIRKLYYCLCEKDKNKIVSYQRVNVDNIDSQSDDVDIDVE